MVLESMATVHNASAYRLGRCCVIGDHMGNTGNGQDQVAEMLQEIQKSIKLLEVQKKKIDELLSNACQFAENLQAFCLQVRKEISQL